MRKKIMDTTLPAGWAALFYLGQVGFLMKYNDTVILIDGYLSDYVDRHFSTDQVPWKRRYPAPCAPEDLDMVDYVFCTHTHADHMDPWTLEALSAGNKKARFYGPRTVAEAYLQIGIPKEAVTELAFDREVSLCGDISVTAIPAAHEELHPDGHGGFEEAGYVFRLGEKKVYHAGDCCPYDGLEERVMDCDAMLLPVNGRDYYRRRRMDVIGNFDSVEAVTLAKNARAQLLVPMHFDLYDVNAVNPAYFVDCLARLDPGRPFHIFSPGERYIL